MGMPQPESAQRQVEGVVALTKIMLYIAAPQSSLDRALSGCAGSQFLQPDDRGGVEVESIQRKFLAEAATRPIQ